MWELSEGGSVVVGLVLAIVAFAIVVWRMLAAHRREQESNRQWAEKLRAAKLATEPPRPMRLARPTGAWAFPMPPPAAKKYVPPVNGTVRVRPGGYVPATESERWDLYVPPLPVDIPAIPMAPAVPNIEEYRGGGGRFGGGGEAMESWPEVEAKAPAVESGVMEVSTVDSGWWGGGGGGGGGGFDGGGFDGGGGEGGSD